MQEKRPVAKSENGPLTCLLIVFSYCFQVGFNFNSWNVTSSNKDILSDAVKCMIQCATYSNSQNSVCLRKDPLSLMPLAFTLHHSTIRISLPDMGLTVGKELSVDSQNVKVGLRHPGWLQGRGGVEEKSRGKQNVGYSHCYLYFELLKGSSCFSILSYQTLPRNMPSHRAQVVPRYPEGYRTLPRNTKTRPESICSVTPSIYDKTLGSLPADDKRRSMRDDTMWQLYEWQQRQFYNKQTTLTRHGTLSSPKTMINISDQTVHMIPTSPSHGSIAGFQGYSPQRNYGSEVSSPVQRGDVTIDRRHRSHHTKVKYCFSWIFFEAFSFSSFARMKCKFSYGDTVFAK